MDSVPKGFEAFLRLVDETYNHNEEDRAMIERSMDISSKELSELNKKLQTESSALRAKLNELENINKLAMDKELKLVDLKKRVAGLEEEIIKVSHQEETTSHQ